MSQLYCSRRQSAAVRLSRGILAATALVGLTIAPAARADDLTASAPSIKLVPKDAAFYSSMLRGREQVEIVAKSNFWKKLKETDTYRQAEMTIALALDQPDNPLSRVMAVLELPENQQAMAVAREMVSDEIFVYGNVDSSDAISVLSDLMNVMRFSGMFYELSGGGELTQEEYMTRMALDSLNSDLERIKVPDVVLGFRIRTQEPAEEQLRRIQAYATVILEQVPDLAPLRKNYKIKKIGGAPFLTLTIDDNVIPWNEIPFDQVAEKKGEYDKLREKLKSLKFVIALGIHKGYVVLSVGKSTDHIAALGSGPSLAEHPQLQRLRDKGAQRYTSLGYLSEPMAKAVALNAKDVDSWLELAERALPTTRLSAEEQRAILTDIKEVATELKKRIPKAGAMVGFSYLTDRGIESYSLNWTENPYIDGSQALPIASHFGVSPLLAVGMRGKYQPQDYDLMVRWGQKARGYFEKYAVPSMDENDQAQYKVFADIAYPILARVDVVNRKKLMPALKDGQSALVLDASLTSKQWMESMPSTGQPTALPAPALILGVSDAALMEQALGEYRLIANDLFKKLRPFVPPNVPEIELPPAKSRKLDDGATVYYYPLPKEFGIDKRLAPNAGLSPQFLVLSVSPRLTVDLLKPQQPALAATGPLADSASKPAAAVVVFDWVQLINLATPWINEGVRSWARAMDRAFQFQLGDDDGNEPIGEPAEDPTAESPRAAPVIKQINQIAELLKAFRGVTSVMYIEDGAQVTHSEALFEDSK